MNIKRRDKFHEALFWDLKGMLAVNRQLQENLKDFYKQAKLAELNLISDDEYTSYVNLLTANYVFEEYDHVHISGNRFVFGVTSDGNKVLLFKKRHKNTRLLRWALNWNNLKP